MGFEDNINKRYSRLLLRYPWLVIILVSGVALLMTALGFITTDLPDFSDPSKGFFARGTGTMTSKLLILRELVERVKQSNRIADHELSGRSINKHSNTNESTKADVHRDKGTSDDEDPQCQNDSDDPVMLIEEDDDNECIIFNDSNGSTNRENWPTLNFIPHTKECLLTRGQLKQIPPKQNKTFWTYSSINENSRNGSEPFINDVHFHQCTVIPPINSAYEFYYGIITRRRNITFPQIMRELCIVERYLYSQLSRSPALDHKQPCRFSLAGLASDMFDRSDCASLTDAQWMQFLTYLDQCIPFAQSGLLRHIDKKRAFVAYESVCSHVCFSPSMIYALNGAVSKGFNPRNILNTGYVNGNLNFLSLWLPVDGTRVSKELAKKLAVIDFRELVSKFQHKSPLRYKQNHLRLRAVNMVDGRVYAAMQHIRQDMYLIALAITLILVISLAYTRSVVVCLVTVYNVLLALGCAYTTYQLVLRITVFPYINLMGFFLLVGLSCDNVFVFDDIWLKELQRSVGSTPVSATDYPHNVENRMTELMRLAKSSLPLTEHGTILSDDAMNTQMRSSSSTTNFSGPSMESQPVFNRNGCLITDPVKATGRTLRHAAVALFITSCTTSAAFFTNLFSKIVYIRMFGLYMGLSIIFLFVVSVTILPAALIITHQTGNAAAADSFITQQQRHGLRRKRKIKDLRCDGDTSDRLVHSTNELAIRLCTDTDKSEQANACERNRNDGEDHFENDCNQTTRNSKLTMNSDGEDISSYIQLSSRPTVNHRIWRWIQMVSRKIRQSVAIMCITKCEQSRLPSNEENRIRPSAKRTLIEQIYGSCIDSGYPDNNNNNNSHSAMSSISQTSYFDKVECFFSKIECIVFKRFLPGLIINYKRLLPIIFAIFGILGLITVFVWPRMKFPSSSRHRFFSGQNHLMEFFEFVVRDEIRAYSDEIKDDITYPEMVFVFGVQNRDNAHFLHPNSKPEIIPSKPPINIFQPQTIMTIDKIVTDFFNSSLFVEFHSLYKQWSLYRRMLSNGNAVHNRSGVLCSERDNLCFGPIDEVERNYRSLQSYIKKSIADGQKAGNIKGLRTNVGSMRIFLLEDNDMHAVGFVVRPNATFDSYGATLHYEQLVDHRLKTFSLKENSTFSSLIGKEVYSNFWYASRQMALFDMQRLIGKGTFQSLISAVVIVALALLLTTCNPLITLLSLLSITFILADTIAVFVLFGWTLNFMETIIIITAVGLSVDFTVHYGVAFLHAPDETGQTLDPISSCCRSSTLHFHGKDSFVERFHLEQRSRPLGGLNSINCVCVKHSHNSAERNEDKIVLSEGISSNRRWMLNQDRSLFNSQMLKKEANMRACIDRVGPAVFMSALTTFLAGLSMCPSRLTSFSQMGFFLMLVMIISWVFSTLFFLPLCLIFGPAQHWGTIKMNCASVTCLKSIRCKHRNRLFSRDRSVNENSHNSSSLKV